MLHNLNHIYYIYNSNIKNIGFELIHYDINIDVFLFIMVFNDFDCIFLFNIYVFLI